MEGITKSRTMIKPNELRIGNLIYFKDKTVKVVDVCGHEITDVPHLGFRPIVSNPDITEYSVCKFFKPIPITEEWLNKNSDSKSKVNNRLTYVRYSFKSSKHTFNVYWDKSGYLRCGRFDKGKIKFVHELQNIFYWYKNQKEELIIKE